MTPAESDQPRSALPTRRLSFASIVAAIVTVAITVVELVRVVQSGEPLASSMRLVATLWLLFGVVVVLGWLILRRLRGEDAPLSPFAITGRVALFLLVLGAWLGIMANQLPCFFGLPNCD